MENNTINFNQILKKILGVIRVKEEEQEKILKEYDALVVQQMTTLFLDKIKDKEGAKEILSSLTNNQGGQEKVGQDATSLLNYFEKNLTEEEKAEIYIASKLSIFLELVEPIIEEAAEEDVTLIGKIFSEDQAFYQMYADWKNKNAENNPNPTS